MKEGKFLSPSHLYGQGWVIKQILANKNRSAKYIERGENLLDTLGYVSYYSIALPTNCLLVWGEPIKGYTPNGCMFDSCDCEVYLYYVE